MSAFPRLKSVRASGDRRVYLEFDDDARGEVDMSDIIGRGIFEVLDNPDFFATVHVSDAGAIAWSNDLEVCPDAAYLKLTGRKLEDVATADASSNA